MTPSGRRRALRLVLGYLLAAAAIFYAIRYGARGWPDFWVSMTHLQPWRLLLSVVACLLALAINASAFSVACRTQSRQGSFQVWGGAWLGTLLSKYIPIGVGHVVGRGAVLYGQGVTVAQSVRLGIFEQGVSLLWCALIASAVLPISGPARALCVVSILMLFAGTLRILGEWGGVMRFGLLSAALYGMAMLPYALAYLVVITPPDVSHFIGALFSATLIGTLTFLAPGGLGVREAGVSMFFSDVQPSNILAGMIATRGLIVLSEVLATGFGQWLLVRSRRAHESA